MLCCGVNYSQAVPAIKHATPSEATTCNHQASDERRILFIRSENGIIQSGDTQLGIDNQACKLRHWVARKLVRLRNAACNNANYRSIAAKKQALLDRSECESVNIVSL